MSHHEQEKCARERRIIKSLLDIADEIHESRSLVDAAFMAAHNLHDHESGPMAALLHCISMKLRGAAGQLEAYGLKEGSTDAA